MKKYVLFILVLVFCLKLSAQQLSHFNQYLFNDLALNPAIAGTSPCKIIGLDIRKQWVGFAGSPSTQDVFFHGSFLKKIGLGGIVYNDLAGDIKMVGGEFDYAYHVVKNRDHLLSFGLGGTVLQYSIDKSAFKNDFSNDPTLSGNNVSKMTYDIGSGVFYKNKYFLISLGAKNLLQKQMVVPGASNVKLVKHYFFTASYNLIITKKIRCEPALFISSIGKPAPQFDFASKFIFKDLYSLGLGYRLRDAVIIYGGLDIGRFTVGYGFEYTVSLLNSFNSGSHEVFLKFNFCKKKSNEFNVENAKRGYKSVICPVW